MQVKFKQRTPDGMLRQPVFLRLRDDKKPAECVWRTEARGDASARRRSRPRAADEPPERPTVAFTNLDKVFWPADGYTKGDLIAYYEGVAEWLLPYLKDRPVVLTRYPDGIDGKSFFQKDAPVYAPSWLRLETMWSEHAEREIRYFVLDDVRVAALRRQHGHDPAARLVEPRRGARAARLVHPRSRPEGRAVRRTSSRSRGTSTRCARTSGCTNFVKTSGSTGLHVLIPLGARYTYEQSRTLAELLARFTAKSLPEIATIVRSVSDRDGKVYLDYLQNGHGRLLVSPFCVRPLPGAPVSMPLEWSQINGRLEARALQHPLGAQVAANSTATRSPACSRSRPICWPRSRR